MSGLDDTKAPWSPLISLGALLVGVIGLSLSLVFAFRPSLAGGLSGPGDWGVSDERALHGTIIDPPEPLPAWTLQTHAGTMLSGSDLHGRLQLIYFGYTACPDVCPMTSALLAETLRGLDALERSQVQVLMVSVDSERDSRAQLARYLGAFDSSFVGLRGNQEDLAQLMVPLGIYHERVGAPGVENYRIDHTSSVALVDQTGRLRSLYPLGFQAEALRADLRRLLRD